MPLKQIIGLAEHARMDVTAPDSLTIHGGAWPVAVERATPGLRAALTRLGAGDGAEPDMVAAVLQTDGPAALPRLFGTLEQLFAGGLVRYAWHDERGAPMIGVRPIGMLHGRGRKAEAEAGRPYLLSRFALARRAGSRMVLESPLAPAEIELHGRSGPLVLWALAEPRRAEDLAGMVDGLSPDAARTILSVLLSHGFVAPADAEGGIPEDRDPAAMQWEFQDLLFHSRTRLGRHSNPYGGAYPFVGRIEPLPIDKPDMAGDVIALARGSDQGMERDPPFGQVMERRRSLRNHGAEAISLDQLGQFLFRSAREQRRIAVDAGQFSQRIYPSGGSMHELETYVVAHRCTGLEPGLYHYRPASHDLCRIAAMSTDLEAVLDQARAALRSDGRPQILLVLTARFQRTAWKYRGVTYSLILKNIGGVFQTFYLVAAAMGLAPCAIGGGDTDRFGKAAGLSYLAEGSVGEFALGTVSEAEAGGAGWAGWAG